MKVLIIEDDPTLNKNIGDALAAENIISESVFDGQLAERILRKSDFDCIIMDINLPGKTGYELCTDFRKFNTETPVLMLTAFSELEDKVKGFDCGADDYLTKPFFMRELILRINSLVKRSRRDNSGSTQNATIIADDIIIHPAQKTVFRQGNEISLTPREYQILVKLCQNKGEVISKGDLIAEIWGSSFDTNTNTVEVYINFLRNKVDKPFGKNSIKTKVGYGYYFESE
ncbi:response regulator transcription factor [Aequorivita sp. H23M31]|uniref:Response regulator transcription factor n=1 Tax=Aequorivita ciconiae TaxID=2494375 RepID=A0A410G6N9_9FLAO|nr:response regulator transcription factor [Aequorivita sp. H23M31]QAA82969.1 response regulator transcription factor [Aequorivita sp. H23M31]